MSEIELSTARGKRRRSGIDIYRGPAPRNNLRDILIARNISDSEFARLLKTTPGTVRQWSTGERGLDLDRIVTKLQCRKKDLIYDEGQNISTIHGCITFGAKIILKSRPTTPDEEKMLQGLNLSGGEDVFRVHTEPPTAYEGCLIVFDDKINGADYDRYLGKKVVAKMKGADAVIKILEGGSEKGKYNLRSYGVVEDSSPTHRDVELEWCAKFKALIEN